MKKLMSLGILTVVIVMMAGCVTHSTVTTYDPATGKITTVTEVSSDVVDKVTQSTKDKTLIVAEDGWMGYASASPGTTDDPTPHGKLWAGRLFKMYFSILKEHGIQNVNWEGVAKVIAAARGNLSIGPTGITDTTNK